MTARTVVIWLIALMLVVLVGMSWDDEPSETDALQASTLDLADAIQQARAASNQKDHP